MHQFYDADQFALVIGADEIASIKKCGVVPFYSFKWFAEMFERLSLPNGRFIVNAFYTRYEFVTKLDLPDVHSLFLGLPNHVSCLVIYLGFPPFFVRSNL